MLRVCLLFSLMVLVGPATPSRKPVPRDVSQLKDTEVKYIVLKSYDDYDQMDRNWKAACDKSGGYFYSTNWPTGELRRVCEFSDGSSIQEL